MGIIEIIILICGIIIFIILVRRFPETSEVKSSTTNRWPAFVVRFNNLKKLIPTKPSNKLPIPFSDNPSEEVKITAQQKQQEPNLLEVEAKNYSPEVKRLLSEAELCFNAEDFEKAEKTYLKIAMVEPQCVLAYNRLGIIYLDKEETSTDAEEAFKQALKYEPENGYILNNLGLLSFNKGLFNEAVGFYEKAISVDGNIASRHANLGLAYLSLRQYAKASHNFAKAWSIDPTNQEFKKLLDESRDRDRRLKSVKTPQGRAPNV